MIEYPAESRSSRFQGRPKAAGPPDPADLPDPAAALEQVRASVHRQLDRIEAIARELASPGTDRDGEPALRLRELAAHRAALEADTIQRQQEWERQVEAIEHDRRLLGEAWEQLERERLAVADSPPPTRSSHVVAPDDRVAPPPRVARSSGGADDAMDQSILRQFEALRQDVRRRAEAHQTAQTDR